MSNERRSIAVLVVDDIADELTTIREILERDGMSVLAAASRVEALDLLDQHFVDLLLVDERLGRSSGTKLLETCRTKFPGLAGVLITAHADLDLAVSAMRAGALDLLQKPTSREELLESVHRALAESRLIREARYHRWRATRHGPFSEIIGEDERLHGVLTIIRQAAPTTAPILIQGESGTGKELLARAIHECSPRRNGPFVAVNAGAIPATLMESTLFGSKKGAFTDSHADQVGLFEAASGGTIFLDEIGETTPEVQVRLLRVLEEKAVRRLGDATPLHVDTRVIAATNVDLRMAAATKQFRSDLYFRLAVVSVTLPPLRERLSDIDALSRHLLDRYARELSKPIKGFAAGCAEKLRAYRWPGNIRELANVVERAVILSNDEMIVPESLLLDSPTPQGLDELLEMDLRTAVQQFERLYLTKLLERAGGNKTRAAQIAGLERTVFHAHMRKVFAEGGV